MSKPDVPSFGALSLLLRILLIACAVLPASAQIPAVPTSAPGSLIASQEYIRADRLGIAFISFIDGNMQPERYHKALILGAGWTRWPLYWDRVERQPGKYDWSAYDRLVAADMDNGLKINAILLGSPGFWREGDSIQNLFAPIFADGTDAAGPDAPINPDNPWAGFVHYAVSRYKPGGLVARHNGFDSSWGIRHWEVWNEPDVPQFWRGGTEAYARLLKVAAIVIKTVDPDAQVIFGGLLFAGQPNFFTRVARQFRADPLSDRFNWFFDIVAVHSYEDPWRSGWLTKVVSDTLADYGLTKPVWVNETGVSVWNDYPGPVWASAPESRQRLATARQQAHFLVMSAVYAWAKGAELVFYHQLFDDCGNYPAGTDFPPHNGEWCANGACYGDAFGLYRNTRDSHCFSQHPHSNTPRPAAAAFQLLAEVFGQQPFAPMRLSGLNEEVTTAVFGRADGVRITALWNNTHAPLTHSFKASAARGTLHFLNGERAEIAAVDGRYAVALEPADDFSYPDLESARNSAIGGEPVILLEAPGA